MAEASRPLEVSDEPDESPFVAAEPPLGGALDDGAAAIATEKLGFQSADGSSRVSWRLWLPPGEPRAILQLVHGMAEHIGRYDELARFFAARGYLVAGHDHIGHGETAPTPDDFGHMPLDGGNDILVVDTHTFAAYLDARYPGLPHVLYGHSMGSFIVRVYLAEWGHEIDAAILSGTATFPYGLTKMGLATTQALAAIHGERAHSDLVNDIAMGTYNAAIDEPRTDFDWIAADEAVVDAYVADERSGFQFTIGGYGALLQLILDMVTPHHAELVPKDVPLLFIAGEEDPVGDMGNGVRAAADLYRTAGVEQVDLKLYPGMRHEVHNEQGRREVLEDVTTWLDAVLESKPAKRFAPRPPHPTMETYPLPEEQVSIAVGKVQEWSYHVQEFLRRMIRNHRSTVGPHGAPKPPSLDGVPVAALPEEGGAPVEGAAPDPFAEGEPEGTAAMLEADDEPPSDTLILEPEERPASDTLVLGPDERPASDTLVLGVEERTSDTLVLGPDDRPVLDTLVLERDGIDGLEILPGNPEDDRPAPPTGPLVVIDEHLDAILPDLPPDLPDDPSGDEEGAEPTS